MRCKSLWVVSVLCLVVLYAVFLLNAVGTVKPPRVEPRPQGGNQTQEWISASQNETSYPLETGNTASAQVNNSDTSTPVVSTSTKKPHKWKTVRKALSLRSKMAGFHKKAGILNPAQWMSDYKDMRDRETLTWLDKAPDESDECHAAQPPWQYPGCLVNINHHYKFIWIKGKKVGGTAIREPLGWICDDGWRLPPDTNQSLCSERLNENSQITLDEAKKFWGEYFVFGFVRNPYSRFASGYEYVQRFHPSERFWVPFSKICTSPFLLPRRARRRRFASHIVRDQVHHLMEQSSCFFTEDGLPAVDFIGQTESLGRDLRTVLREINARKPDHLPKLGLKDGTLPKENSNPSSNYAFRLYGWNFNCLDEVEHHFCQDFDRLGYEAISTSESARVQGNTTS